MLEQDVTQGENRCYGVDVPTMASVGLDLLISEFELERGEVRHVPSPGRCIYCNASGVKLTDEHVIPYALAANTLILDQSCCVPCQRLNQSYEQEVLKKQLGLFRAQIEAPTRDKSDRPESARFRFVEVNGAAQPIRDLGHRDIPIAQAPLIFNLWSSPPPRLLREASRSIDERGRPWTYCERDVAGRLCRSVAEEEGAGHVAMELGKVNRLHYLRALAKTAHAYAAAELGLDAFEPILPNLILNKSDDVAQFVGDSFVEGPFDLHPHIHSRCRSERCQIGPPKAICSRAYNYILCSTALRI